MLLFLVIINVINIGWSTSDMAPDLEFPVVYIIFLIRCHRYVPFGYWVKVWPGSQGPIGRHCWELCVLLGLQVHVLGAVLGWVWILALPASGWAPSCELPNALNVPPVKWRSDLLRLTERSCRLMRAYLLSFPFACWWSGRSQPQTTAR